MVPLEVVRSLVRPTPSKILFFVMDGLGGMPHPEIGKSELEVAHLPHLNTLTSRAACGLIDPIAPGITPGSGPAHLALFGYDPLRYDFGRGVLSALGIDFPLQQNDLAIRANFATIDGNGVITDRRAGRIPTELNRELCALLRQIHLPGVELFVETEAGHRALVVLRGERLSDRISDTDPQREGVPPAPVQPLAEEATPTAQLVNAFLKEVFVILRENHPANALLLRGAAQLPDIPSMRELYQLTPAAIAAYPMYRGLGKLLGMDVLPTGETIWDEYETLQEHWESYDFFFFHVKATDTAGEDGDFHRKVQVLEEVDTLVPALLRLRPDVLVVTGDHSTPTALRAHSWHPVPFLLYGETCISDDVAAFSERALAHGSLGRFPAQDVMLLALGHAQKLNKYGA